MYCDPLYKMYDTEMCTSTATEGSSPKGRIKVDGKIPCNKFCPMISEQVNTQLFYHRDADECYTYPSHNSDDNDNDWNRGKGDVRAHPWYFLPNAGPGNILDKLRLLEAIDESKKTCENIGPLDAWDEAFWGFWIILFISLILIGVLIYLFVRRSNGNGDDSREVYVASPPPPPPPPPPQVKGGNDHHWAQKASEDIRKHHTEGLFTKKTEDYNRDHGTDMSVQEFAKFVGDHPEHFSKKDHEEAAFARNI